MTGNKFIINQNGEIEDTMAHITFDSFMEILIVLNGQSRQLKKLSEENTMLKKANLNLRNNNTDLRRENEYLKQEIKQLNHDLDMYEENNTNEVLNDLKIELTSRLNYCIEEFKE